MKTLAIVLLLCAATVGAQDKPIPAARFNSESREFKIDLAAMGVGWTLDTISTHQLFAAHPDFSEQGGLFNGSRSTPKIMCAWLAVDAGSAFIGYEWKNHVRNRWLHPFWRAWLIVPAVGHTQAAVGNWRR